MSSFLGIGEILGRIIGQNLNKKISVAAVEKLFIGLITEIIFISIYNGWNYFIST